VSRSGRLARAARAIRGGGSAPRIGATALPPMMRGGQAFNASSQTHPDLYRWQPFAGSPDSDLLPELPMIRARARDLTRNHGVAGGALQTQLDNVLGCGLWLAPMPDYILLGKDRAWASEWRRRVKALWRNYADTTWCDAGKSLTLDGLATQVFSGAWMNGDGLALPLWLPEPFAPAATKLQVIESDRLCNPYFKMDTASLRGGVEIDQYGAAVAYHIRKSHPGDTYWYMTGADFTWDRIEATTGWGRKRVIHAHDKGRAGQSRGIPALASTMHEFKVLKDYRGAELKATVVNAMVGMVIESALSQEGLLDLLSSDKDALNKYVDGLNGRQRTAVDFSGGGMIMPIPLGDKVSGFTPARPSTAYEPFTRTAFRHIATGLNMPYELLMKDFSQTNYSSARAALLEAWRFFTGRRNWLALNFYQPVYELFFEEMVDAGEIEAPTFYEQKCAWCRARWIGPGRGWVDPLKEAQAAELRMDIFVSTLEDECAEQGKDWEEVLEQIAEEDARLVELKIDRTRVAKTLQPKGATDEGQITPEQPAVAAALESVALSNRETAVSNRELAASMTALATRPLPAPQTVFADGAFHMEHHAGDVHLHQKGRGAVEKEVTERDNEGRIVKTLEREIEE
jgi:lambda family phage portal protein